jgi:hypothetical protein
MAHTERQKQEAAARRAAMAGGQPAPAEPPPVATSDTATTQTVGQAAMQAPALAQPDVLDRILDAVQGLAARVEQIEARGTVVSGPQFVKMQPRDADRPTPDVYQPPEALKAQAIKSLTQDGQTVSRNVGPLENPKTLRNIPPQHHPMFRSGDLVNINPDAEVWGSDGKRWADVLAQKKSSGQGTVLSVQGHTRTFEPKYTVQVPGLTQRNGDGYRESELLPA